MLQFNLEPQSGVGGLELPVGWIDSAGALQTAVTIKEMTGVEEDLLAARGLSTVTKLSRIMSNCITAIGPYTDPETIAQAVLDLPSRSDRLVLLLAIRSLSLGSIYPMDWTCSACQGKMQLQVNLQELEVNKPEGFDPLVRQWTETLKSGAFPSLTWRTMDGRGDLLVEALTDKDQDQLISALLLGRVVKLGDRVIPLDKKPLQHAALLALKALPNRVREQLRTAFDAREAVLDTTMEITCAHCRHEEEGELDLAQTSFFFPARGRRKPRG